VFRNSLPCSLSTPQTGTKEFMSFALESASTYWINQHTRKLQSIEARSLQLKKAAVFIAN
jgi:hypothetical protein